MGLDISKLSQSVIDGDRRALSRAITLVESTRADHRGQAVELLGLLARADRQALRVGLSGTPGVGKSTFTEGFGMMLIGLGLRVAVLAVDPSSTRSGGSILGDKTRMDRLSREAGAFIRPSPSNTALGGVARRTREAIAVCEAAGFDVVIIETVGVGQSETMVADCSDVFLLLLAPSGGDELQGVKRGIMEIADMIVVNKADGDLKHTAMRTCADYSGALRLLRKRPQDPEDFPKAMTISALEEEGLGTVWDELTTLSAWRKEHSHWSENRERQAVVAFDEDVRAGLLGLLERDADIKLLRTQLQEKVRNGDIQPEHGAKTLLKALKNQPDSA